jgi:hypothetical protein
VFVFFKKKFPGGDGTRDRQQHLFRVFHAFLPSLCWPPACSSMDQQSCNRGSLSPSCRYSIGHEFNGYSDDAIDL